MLYLVVVAHIDPGRTYIDDPGVLNFLISFVAEGVVRVTISMLTCMSGFLVFHKALDLNFSVLVRKRASALVAPLLLWNVPLVLVLYLVQSQGLVDHDFAARKTMYPFDLMTWLNGVFSLTDYPVNFPMYFVRDLFVISLLAPLTGALIRRAPYPGLIAFLAVFSLDLDGSLILNDAMFVTFYIGGMAAIQKWDLRRLDRYAGLMIASLLLICCVFATAAPVDPFWLRVSAPFLVWPVFSLLAGTRLGAWLGAHARASIFLFMLHGVLVLILRAEWPQLYGGKVSFLVWLATPVCIAVLCQITYLVLARFAPSFLTVLLGGRRPVTR